MKFTKWKVLHLGWTTLIYEGRLGEELVETSSVEELGVLMDKKMSCLQARRTTVFWAAPTEGWGDDFSLCYAFVKPLLEYCI